jgi:hypothetical protein
VVRQPFFRETDGQLIMRPGYEEVSRQFGVFNPGQFPEPGGTREAAEAALAKLRELLCEFSFVSPVDEAAALSAILTAVVRQTLPLAPAFMLERRPWRAARAFYARRSAPLLPPRGA